MGRIWVALILILALTTGCSWFGKKKDPPATGQPPAEQQQPGGQTGASPGTQNGSQAPAGPAAPEPPATQSVQQSLRRGSTSPDGKYVVAAVTTGQPDDIGVWMARADLTGVKRLSKEIQAYAGPPRWTPWNTVLFAVENQLNPNVTWFEAEPATGGLKEFLPALLKGTRALVGPDAFGPDGKQVVFSTGNCLCATPTGTEEVQVYVVNTDGTDKRLLGTNVMAGFPGGRLVVAPAGK